MPQRPLRRFPLGSPSGFSAASLPPRRSGDALSERKGTIKNDCHCEPAPTQARNDIAFYSLIAYVPGYRSIWRISAAIRPAERSVSVKVGWPKMRSSH